MAALNGISSYVKVHNKETADISNQRWKVFNHWLQGEKRKRFGAGMDPLGSSYGSESVHVLWAVQWISLVTRRFESLRDFLQFLPKNIRVR